MWENLCQLQEESPSEKLRSHRYFFSSFCLLLLRKFTWCGGDPDSDSGWCNRLCKSSKQSTAAFSRQCLLLYIVLGKKTNWTAFFSPYLLYSMKTYEVCSMGQENLIVPFLSLGLWDVWALKHDKDATGLLMLRIKWVACLSLWCHTLLFICVAVPVPGKNPDLFWLSRAIVLYFYMAILQGLWRMLMRFRDERCLSFHAEEPWKYETSSCERKIAKDPEHNLCYE